MRVDYTKKGKKEIEKQMERKKVEKKQIEEELIELQRMKEEIQVQIHPEVLERLDHEEEEYEEIEKILMIIEKDLMFVSVSILREFIYSRL